MTENAKTIIGEKNRVHMTGKKMSDETKRKMSIARTGKKGKPMTEEQKYARSIYLSEHPPRHTLSKSDVLEIRRLSEEEHFTYTKISKIFDVTPQCISDICHRKRWKYI